MQDMQPDNTNMMPQGETDREGAMAKADLYKLANYSLKLFKQMQDEDQLEGWVQAKITKAADYIASVYHYLEYEMKFSTYGEQLDNAEMYSESQKHAIKNKLMEAKEKVKALKKAQALKADAKEDKKMSEGVLSGGEESCTECGGTGMIYREATPVPDHVKGKVEKYNRQAKAFHAASKRIDRNKNGIPDELENDQPVDEETSSTGGEITRPKKGVTKHTQNPNRFSDEEHTEPKSKAKAQSAADKSGDKAADKAEEKEGKNWEKRFGKDSVTRVKDGKKVDPTAKKEKEVDETYGQGVYEGKGKKPDFLDVDKDKNKKESFKKAVADKKAGPKKGVNPFAKKVAEAKEEKFDALKHVKNPTKGEKDAAKDVKRGSYADRAAMLKSAEADGRLKEGVFGDDDADLAKKSPQLQQLIALRKDPKYQSPEAKASLEARIKKQKDRVSLDKGEVVGKDGQPVAVKESVNESAELNRMKEFLTRLNG